MLKYIFDKGDDIPYPSEWPPYFCTHNIQCTMLQGQCECGHEHRIDDWDLGRAVETRLDALEAKVEEATKCRHQYKTVGGQEGKFRLFYSPKGTGYHECFMCGHKRFIT